jgi:predicted RNase H-like HicB family nuclease
MKYTIVIEQTDTGYSAYVPDLPVVVAAAKTRDELMKLMSEAIPMHMELLREDGDDIPLPKTFAAEIEVAA